MVSVLDFVKVLKLFNHVLRNELFLLLMMLLFFRERQGELMVIDKDGLYIM